MKPINISSSDLNQMKIIGQGSEGKIYRKDSKTLYKIYHQYMDYSIPVSVKQFDEEGVNITPVKQYKTNGIQRNTIQYFDNDGVRLSRKEAIARAIKLQKNISLTKLPQNAIYVDGRLKGCELYYHKNCKNIYWALNLPLKLRLRILRMILEQVEELVSQNIYHVDLCQHPDAYSKNTNILLSPKLEPKIIDIDGHSAIYSEVKDDELLRRTELSLSTLFLEIISKEYISDYINNPDLEDLHEMIGNTVSYELIEQYINNNLNLTNMKLYLNRKK